MTIYGRWGMAMLFGALAWLGRPAAQAAEAAMLPWIEDGANVTTGQAAWVETRSDRLHGFSRVTGVKILVRLLAKSPTEAEDKVPGAYMRAMAKRLAVDGRGALVVYFADEKEFRVWIGDACAATFVGEPGSARKFTANGRMHEVKEAFLSAAQKSSDAAFTAAQRAAPAGNAPTEALRVTLHADAIIDGLIAKLGSTPRS